jgi:hypothetical protein
MVTFGDFMATTMVPDIARRLRDEMAAMLFRVADREKNKDVAERLRQIANDFKGAKL